MDADKIKDFLVYNFEKAIVAVVVLMSGFLVYSGLSMEDIKKQHDPDRLVEDARNVRREVDEDHTEAIIPERRPTFDIAGKQSEFREPVKPELYDIAGWDPSIAEKNKVRRQDPVLTKPVGIQTVGVIGSMAYRSSDGVYALADLEPADPLEVEEQKPERRSRRGRGRRGGMSEEEMMMEMGMDSEMMMMEEEMMMMDSMESESPAGSPGQVRKLDAKENLGAVAESTKAFSNNATQEPVPGPGIFIAGTAAIPHKELIESYQDALSNAAEYEPRMRDRPNYVAYEVQRADVTNKTIDQLQESDWITRDKNRQTMIDAALYWAGFAPEIVPSDYRMPGVTMWIPPILLDR